MKFILIIMFILFSSCSYNSYKREKFTFQPNEKQIWIDSYKYEAFYGCIKEGIGNDSLRIILEKKDLFNPNSDIDFSTIDNARALGKKIIEKMPKAYIKIDKGEDNLKDKNFISNSCLIFYASKELDSIAKELYEENLKKK